MTNITVYQYPAIGACLQCNQLFLVTTPDTRCLLCGAAPGALLPMLPFLRAPLAVPEDELEGVEEPAPPTLYDATCPLCGGAVHVLTTDPDVCLFPSPPALPAEEAASVPAPTAAAAPSPDETPPAAPEEPLP